MRALALVLALAAAQAGAGPAGSEPPPPPGARQTGLVEHDFDRYPLPVAPFGKERPPVRELSGEVRRTALRLDDPQATVAGVIEGYRERLAALGFQPVFACANEGCGGFDFRFGAEILPPPAMLVDVRDFAQLSMRRPEPEEYVSVLASRVLGVIHIQTVTVVPSPRGEPESGADAGAGAAPVAREERELLGALTARGHVPVAGLDFEVGGARLSPGSATALDRLARMMAGHPDLSVIIVGHSDNQGPLDVNIDLSRQRAEAVMAALVERGVPADRMEARGVGFLAPVESNATEEGRAANRRVELVLR